MRTKTLVGFILSAFIATVDAADAPNWSGEYADKKFLNGQAVFQLSTTQEATQSLKIGFDAVYNDGRGCAPEAEAVTKIAGTGALRFNFQDNHHNTGSGTITRAGDDMILSLKVTRVADRECTVFYRENMRLKRMGKK